MASEFVTTALALLGLEGPTDQEGKTDLPETRLRSAADARRILWAMLQEDNDRSLQRALVKGMVDGHPPYPDGPRKAEGRGWECNLNFMEGQAIMNRTAVPYYNLFARAHPLVECRTAFNPEHADYETWNKRMSIRFHNLLKRWREFNWNVQQVSYWMRLHGVGFALPENDYGWKFRALETGNVLAPRGAPSCLDHRVPFIIVRVAYRITELWGFIKNEEAAAKAGWNVDAVKAAIKYGMKGLVSTSDWYAQPWEWYERILKNNDLTASFTDGDLVNCAIMLYQEFARPGDYTGKISKVMFTEFRVVGVNELKVDPKQVDNDKANQDFLYSDPNCYDSYLEGLIPFFRNTGDGTWHSVRGYAMEAFKHLEVENRLLCQGINRAFLNSCVGLSFASEKGRQASQLQVWGTVVKLPKDSTFQQLALQGGLQDVVLMQRLLSNHLANNLGTSGPRQMTREDGRGEMPTARQVDYQAANEASIAEGDITVFYESLDNLYTFMFNRASNPATSDPEAKRFQEECEEDGVPEEALQQMEYIRANRQNGYGSPEMGIMKFNQSMQLVPMLPEDGKQNWLEDAVTSIFGPEKTSRFAPRIHVPDDQDWQASVENMMIANGKLPVVEGGQDDVIHLESHFADAQETLTPIEQGMQNNGHDPQPLAFGNAYATTMGQHVEAHIQRLLKDPTRKSEAKLFQDEFKQLEQSSKELGRALVATQRQMQLEGERQNQATALSALDQAKVESVQAGTEMAAEKVRSQIENQKVKTIEAMRMKRMKAAHDMEVDRMKMMELPEDVT